MEKATCFIDGSKLMIDRFPEKRPPNCAPFPQENSNRSVLPSLDRLLCGALKCEELISVVEGKASAASTCPLELHQDAEKYRANLPSLVNGQFPGAGAVFVIPDPSSDRSSIQGHTSHWIATQPKGVGVVGLRKSSADNVCGNRPEAHVLGYLAKSPWEPGEDRECKKTIEGTQIGLLSPVLGHKEKITGQLLWSQRGKQKTPAEDVATDIILRMPAKETVDLLLRFRVGLVGFPCATATLKPKEGTDATTPKPQGAVSWLCERTDKAIVECKTKLPKAEKGNPQTFSLVVFPSTGNQELDQIANPDKKNKLVFIDGHERSPLRITIERE